ncbi:hypothetical protein, partial [Bacteroides ovatus]|uniref:hypothetical protein n=1 Tax=Bacteroides ovatus TaxID=28116 RepID=UPI00321ABC12
QYLCTGKNKLRREVALCGTGGYKGNIKGNGAVKKEDLPVASAKKDSRAALHGTARLRALPYRCHVCSPHSYRYLLL